MGLKNAIQNAVKSGFQALGDVRVSAAHEAFSSTTVNASAGTQTTVYSTSENLKIIIDTFELRQVDGEVIQANDRMALIPQTEIPGLTPRVNDRLKIDGLFWEIVQVKFDPAVAMFTIQIRTNG